jgi:hypothetical protein
MDTASTLRLAYQVHAWLQVEQRAQAAPHQVVIVDDENADRVSAGHFGHENISCET